MMSLTRRSLSQSRIVLGRLFFPLFAITIIAGMMIWGPWVSLGVTVVAIATALRLM